MLFYRKQSLGTEKFYRLMQYLLAANSTDIIVGDLNYDLLKFLHKKLLNNTTDHVQMAIKPTHIFGSLTDIYHTDRHISCLYQGNIDGRIFY